MNNYSWIGTAVPGCGDSGSSTYYYTYPPCCPCSCKKAYTVAQVRIKEDLVKEPKEVKAFVELVEALEKVL